MNRDPELRRKLVVIMMRSTQSLNAAKSLFAQGYFDNSASKPYYAVFHSLQAALLTLNLSFSKHSGVLGGFNKEFIQSGILPSDFKEKAKRLFEDRQIGDYSYERRISEEAARQDIEDAGEIIKAIFAYLKREDFLDPGAASV